MNPTVVVQVLRRILLAFALVLLLVLAWGLCTGAMNQLPRAHTMGQQIETLMQFACGLLSLLSVLTVFWHRRWGRAIRIAWVVSLVVVAGASSLVWGPPMLLTATAFAGTALLVGLAVLGALRVALHRQAETLGAKNAA